MKTIDVINYELCKFSLKRCEKLGKSKSGMYGYYLKRAKNGRIISDSDEYLIKYIDENIRKNKIICELGAGLAQVSIALSWFGYQINAYENDTYRIKYCMDANNLFKTGVNVIKSKFQNLDTSNCGCIIGNNLANGVNGFEKDLGIIKKWIAKKITVVINSELYGKTNNVKQVLQSNSIKYQELKNNFIRF